MNYAEALTLVTIFVVIFIKFYDSILLLNMRRILYESASFFMLSFPKDIFK